MEPYYMVGFSKYNENHDPDGKFGTGVATSDMQSQINEASNSERGSKYGTGVATPAMQAQIDEASGRVTTSQTQGKTDKASARVASRFGTGIATTQMQTQINDRHDSTKTARARKDELRAESKVQKYNENHDEKGQFASGDAAPASLKGTTASDLHAIITGSHSPNSPKLDRARTRLAKKSDDGSKQYTNAGQAASALREPDGGFTYNPVSGEAATHGFAVSTYPELSQTVDVGRMSDPELKTAIQNYESANSQVLSQSGNFIGGWHDPDTHIGYLDVTKVTPSASVARTLSQAHDQIAFFDMQTGSSVTVNKNAKSGQ